VRVDAEGVSFEEAREAGSVHVGHQIWHQLGLNAILSSAGLCERACLLSEVMTLNRLIFPLSEHAMPDWIRNTALGDILGTDHSSLNVDAEYRNLERLHPHRELIERQLGAREKSLFQLSSGMRILSRESTRSPRLFLSLFSP
jgi:hypothetical protein